MSIECALLRVESHVRNVEPDNRSSRAEIPSQATRYACKRFGRVWESTYFRLSPLFHSRTPGHPGLKRRRARGIRGKVGGKGTVRKTKKGGGGCLRKRVDNVCPEKN